MLTFGLCSGKGRPNGEMCIEALITQILDEPFSDEPSCVTNEIRNFKISLNDKKWSSNHARAKGLRDIGIAQIGSNGLVNGKEFLSRLQTKITGILIPDLFRKVFKDKKEILNLVDICEKTPTKENCLNLRSAADVARAAAAYADYYLIMCANLALEVLKEMNSPGCAWL